MVAVTPVLLVLSLAVSFACHWYPFHSTTLTVSLFKRQAKQNE